MYQFHFFDQSGGVPVLDFFDCIDDGEATRTGGEQLALHPSCDGVDVFHGERLVVRLLRPFADTSSANGTSAPHRR